MSAAKEQLLEQLGFRFGTNGPQAARAMMLEDLRVLFSHVPAPGSRADYGQAVCAENIQGKPTKKSRELAPLKPSVVHVAIPKRTLNDGAVLKVWLAEVELLLAEKLKSGPVAF